MFETLIYKPFSWLLLQLTMLTGSYALGLVLFAVVIKVALLYFSAKGKIGVLRQQRIQPKIQALQKQYGKDKVRLQAEMQKLYEKENVSMTGGCLWMFLPIPIMIMLFNVVREPLTRLMGFTKEQLPQLHEFLISVGAKIDPELASNDGYLQLKLAQETHVYFDKVSEQFGPGLHDINFSFLGIDLSQIPTVPWTALSFAIIVPLLSGATALLAYYVGQKAMGKYAVKNQQGNWMIWFSPVFSVVIGFSMPAAMGVYWIAQNIFQTVQDWFLTKHYIVVMEQEEKHKEELEARRRAAEEAMRLELQKEREAEMLAKKAKRKPGQVTYKMQKKPKKK